MNDVIITIIGFLGQAFFMSRVIVQWVLSEKAKKVLSPTIFWNLSLMGSFIFITYAILREDMVLLGGQLISYFIYIRNLQLKNFWGKLPLALRVLAISFPIGIVGWLVFADSYNLDAILNNDDITATMLTVGWIGQVVFSSRFWYQWLYSERKKESTLPPGFWWISLTGSALIFIYALLRVDWVVLAGHSFGLIVYLRNIFLFYNRGKRLKEVQAERKPAQK